MRTWNRAAAGAALALLCPLAGADETDGGVDLVAGVALGVTQLDFDAKLDADATFNTYTLFGSAGLGKAYASVSYADTLREQNISEEDEVGEAGRTDIDVTVGYRVSDAWTVFLGYKDGETDIDFRVRDTRIVQDESYREDGFYGGATYTWALGRAGALNFTLAYIYFDSDLRFTQGVDDDDDDEDEPVEFDDLEGTYSGDARGFSAGVNWVIPLSRSLAFRSQYKINQYDLEVTADGLDFDPKQRLSYFDVGLLYAF